MRKRKPKEKKKKRLLPAVLLSLAVGSLATLAVVYSPGEIRREAETVIGVFTISETTPPPDTILFRVQNGVGVNDLASRAQTFLETRTGDVVFYAPGPPQDAGRRDYELTVVLSHDTSYAAALRVAEVLQLGDSSVVMLLPRPGFEPEVDVTVILGRDRDDPSFYIPYRD